MKRVLFPIFFCVLIAGQFAYGQVRRGKAATKPARAVKLSAGDYPSLPAQAEELNKATVSGDWDKIADLTHPKIVVMMGGRTVMLSFIRKAFDQMKSEGFEVLSFDIGPVSQIEMVGREMFAVIEARMIMKTPNDKRLHSRSSLVGISADRGKTWKFISAASPDKFKKIFPAAAAKMKIPVEEPPTLLEN